MRRILPTAPFDLIDLLLYFKGLEIVEFRFMGLKLCMEFVLAGFLLLEVSRPYASDIQFPWSFLELWQGVDKLTDSFLSNSTTRPPLSPVAR